MTEKLIFEFRTERDEDGNNKYRVRQGDGEEYTLSGPPCQPPCPPPMVFMPRRRGVKWGQTNKDSSRHQMRETLDFFEQLYDDLYDEEDTNKDY